MPTLFTDPRSGGTKKSSGVNVLPSVSTTWSQVRDDNSNSSIDWLIASFDGNSKTDITVVASGSGGVEECAKNLPQGVACYGGCRLRRNGRFVTFFHVAEGTPVMQRGRGEFWWNVKYTIFNWFLGVFMMVDFFIRSIVFVFLLFSIYFMRYQNLGLHAASMYKNGTSLIKRKGHIDLYAFRNWFFIPQMYHF